jgi:mannosyltransferase OCH1-like enzyme
MIFPKNIFQVWYQGCNNIERNEFKINMKNWKDLNTDWRYYCVDDKFMEESCYQFSTECHKIYRNLKLMHLKIDLARYVILYLYGGVYVDMDAYILRPLNHSKTVQELINVYEQQNKHVVGLSKLNINMFESLIMSGDINSYNNSIMFSSPGNPALKRFIEFVLKNIVANENSNLNNYFVVQNSTGPKVFNRFFGEPIRDSELVIFDSNVFEPCDIGQNCSIDNNTIAIHMFERSWLSKYTILLIDIYYALKPTLLIAVIVLFIYMCRRKV